MNAVDRSTLDAIPTPVDNAGQPASACVVNDDGCWRLAWLVGTKKQVFGDHYPSAKAAAAASRYLNESRAVPA